MGQCRDWVQKSRLIRPRRSGDSSKEMLLVWPGLAHEVTCKGQPNAVMVLLEGHASPYSLGNVRRANPNFDASF